MIDLLVRLLLALVIALTAIAAPRSAPIPTADPVDVSGVSASGSMPSGAPRLASAGNEPAPGAPTPKAGPTTQPRRAAPSVRPRPVPAVRSTGVSRSAVAIRATWYCNPPRSRCSAGCPAGGLYAAISPDLRAWTGRIVRVRYGAAHVDVRVIDCDCATEHGIDLYAAAFARLAPLSAGDIAVTLELLG